MGFTLRIVVLALGTLSLIAGIGLLTVGQQLVGIELLVMGIVAVGGVLVERSGYQPRARQPQNLKPTGERFVDPTSGTLTDVWEDPATGEREYRPATAPGES